MNQTSRRIGAKVVDWNRQGGDFAVPIAAVVHNVVVSIVVTRRTALFYRGNWRRGRKRPAESLPLRHYKAASRKPRRIRSYCAREVSGVAPGCSPKVKLPCHGGPQVSTRERVVSRFAGQLLDRHRESVSLFRHPHPRISAKLTSRTYGSGF